jgi:hypothetical protein
MELNIQKQYLISIKNECGAKCPVKVYPAIIRSAGEMRKHLGNRHLKDIIIIEEEGLLPRCTKCGLFQSIVGEKHQKSADCKRFTEIKEKRQQAEVQKAAAQFFSQSMAYPSNTPRNSSTDNDQAAINRDLQKARQKWGMIGRILAKKRANPKVMRS